MEVETGTALHRILGQIGTKIEETIDPHLYYCVVEDATKSPRKGLVAMNYVQQAARYILLLDVYYETHEQWYFDSAEAVKQSLFKCFSDSERQAFSDKYAEISMFWEYESSLREKSNFSREDREDYLRKKSSDTLLYALVAGFVHPFGSEVIEALHFTQQLQDIYDDLTDVVEDRESDAPNLVFLFSGDYRRCDDLTSVERYEIAEIVADIRRNILQCVGIPLARKVTYAEEICLRAALYDISINRILGINRFPFSSLEE